MTSQQKPTKSLHISLWLVQILLAASMLYGGLIKLFQSIDTLSAMWPWTDQIPVLMVRLTGVIDLLAALGLILPSISRIKPQLTPLAAIGTVLLMISAGTFHLLRGEEITVNVVFAVMAIFVAWGRFKKAPITAK